MTNDNSPPPGWTAQAVWATPLGPMRFARTDQGLGGLWFSGQKWHPSPFDAPIRQDDVLLSEAAAQVSNYFLGHRLQFDLPLDLRGTPFQRSVWRVLQTIRSGSTVSYADIACAVGSPQAVRAVGAAVGRNPVSVIVPCHRVIGRDGTLTGYAGGLARKEALLRLEGFLPAGGQVELL